MKTTRLSNILLTALAPISWGTTYFVATEFLPPNHPILVAALRALPVGLLLTVIFRQLPKGVWWWRILVLGLLNIGLFQALLFVAVYRLPGGVAATAGAVQPLLVVLLAWPILGELPLTGVGIVLASVVLGQQAGESPSVPSARRPRVVIVGAGFAGMRAAQKLSQTDAEILIVDRNNYHTFIPLLYQVATGFITPHTIAYPIRNWVRRIPNARFLLADVEALDLENQRIITASDKVDYDYLMIATGSQTRFLGVPGAPKHTFTLRTLDDAIALRHQVLQSLESAAQTNDRRYLTFVIVGGGPTGIELAGALHEQLAGPFQRDYPTLDLSQARISLIQSGDSLLKGLPDSLGRYTARQLDKRGIELRFNTKVATVDPDGVELSDGSRIDAATVIWTAGVLAEKPDLSQPEDWDTVGTARQQKIVAGPTLQIEGYPYAYVAGDTAYVEQDDEALVGVAPEALQQGDTVAANIQRQLEGRRPQPFQYFDKGRAAIIARHAGVAYLLSKIKVTGPLAWLTWLVIHLYYLPGIENRFILLSSWLRDYFWRDRAQRQLFKPFSHSKISR